MLISQSRTSEWILTEFALPAGRVYRSTFVDCLDGRIGNWAISITFDSALVNPMLVQAIPQLPEGERPLIPSGRGC